MGASEDPRAMLKLVHLRGRDLKASSVDPDSSLSPENRLVQYANSVRTSLLCFAGLRVRVRYYEKVELLCD